MDQEKDITGVILMGSAGVFNALMNASENDLVLAQAMYQTVGTLLQVEALRQQAAMQQAQVGHPPAQPTHQPVDQPVERGRIIQMPPRV